jgi:pimeloyl-ACP methyl ester carboxylesterase
MRAHQLLEKGFMVISFDAAAHGKSSGKTINIVEYIKTIEAITEAFGSFKSAIGHSFGGMGLLNTAAKNTFLKSLVAIGSGDKVEAILFNFSKNLGLKRDISNKMKFFLEKE